MDITEATKDSKMLNTLEKRFPVTVPSFMWADPTSTREKITRCDERQQGTGPQFHRNRGVADHGHSMLPHCLYLTLCQTILPLAVRCRGLHLNALRLQPCPQLLGCVLPSSVRTDTCQLDGDGHDVQPGLEVCFRHDLECPYDRGNLSFGLDTPYEDHLGELIIKADPTSVASHTNLRNTRRKVEVDPLERSGGPTSTRRAVERLLHLGHSTVVAIVNLHSTLGGAECGLQLLLHFRGTKLGVSASSVK
jgi:hypothetical protein